MNYLGTSKSKYLLQHADNPVDWYPWGQEPFELAKKENKPVLISIGYAACHWCHVMAHESFEDKEVAGYMNEHFINIKVDREEHPDVDYFYMDALQSLGGGGGWPLNMFVTPDKKPFYGGTYFPTEPKYGRRSWMDLLVAVNQAWHTRRDELEKQTKTMIEHLKQVSVKVGISNNVVGNINEDLTEKICRNILENADKEAGGFGNAPKFPASFSLRYLFDFYTFRKRQGKVDDLGKEALEHATFSLDKMLWSGIYDHIGGGFFRYATDKDWQLPHYEKMLYDNALMISILSTAYKITGTERYRQAIEQTIAFCNREFKNPANPGFYASLDADSGGKEGGYYTWTMSEWQSALGDEYPAVSAYYGMEMDFKDTPEHSLMAVKSEKEIRDTFHLSKQDWTVKKVKAIKQLYRQRLTRPKPGVDDKILLSWNALMSRALQEASVALNHQGLLEVAERHLNWLLSAFGNAKEGLQHVCQNGEAYIEAKLDDWAFLINAMIYQGSFSGNNHWLVKAETMTKRALELFKSEQKGFLYYSDSRAEIPIRKIEVYDGAQPSANAVMAENLLVLGNCFEQPLWYDRAIKMLEEISPTVERFARSFGYWGVLIGLTNGGLKTLIVCGKNSRKRQEKWQKMHYPDVFTIINKEGNEGIPILVDKPVKTDTQLYLCHRFECLPPQVSLNDIILAIKKNG